jgi:mannonate dehydratase
MHHDNHDQEKKSMQRRGFVKAVSLGSVGAAMLGATGAGCASAAEKPAPAKTAEKKPLLMKVGCQSGGTSIENLEFKARHGVFNIDGGAPKYIPGKGWDLDESMRMREACEKYGISLDAYHLPLTSAGIDKVETPNIMLGKSPARDREIADIQQMISVAGKTGVHCLNYNTIILPILRTGFTVDPKRGNASYNTWNYQEALKNNEGLTVAGVVDIDEMYARITTCSTG